MSGQHEQWDGLDQVDQLDPREATLDLSRLIERVPDQLRADGHGHASGGGTASAGPANAGGLSGSDWNGSANGSSRSGGNAAGGSGLPRQQAPLPAPAAPSAPSQHSYPGSGQAWDAPEALRASEAPAVPVPAAAQVTRAPDRGTPPDTATTPESIIRPGIAPASGAMPADGAGLPGIAAPLVDAGNAPILDVGAAHAGGGGPALASSHGNDVGAQAAGLTWPGQASGDDSAAAGNSADALAPDLPAEKAARPEAGSRADLRQRLERLPFGHPSSPYHVDGQRKPPPPRLKHLELAPPARDWVSELRTGGDVVGSYRRAAGTEPDDSSPSPGVPDGDHQHDAVTRNDWSGSSATEADAVLGARDSWAGSDGPPGQDGGAADLGRADGSGADLGRADGSGAALSGADPSGADPSGADPSGADPSGADPSGADPSGADGRADSHRADSYRSPSHRADGDGADDGTAMFGRTGQREQPPGQQAGGRAHPRHAASDADFGSLAPAARTGANGSWTWGQASLTRDHVRVADEARDRFGAAEGRTIFGGYGEGGLTPMMRQVEQRLAHGRLAPGAEQHALLGPDAFRARFADMLRRHPDRAAEQLARRVPGALTYAFVFEPEHYSDGTWLVQEALEARGYQLQARKNTWGGAENRCVLTMWRDPASDLPFQVQFHTAASLEARQLARTSATLISDQRIPVTEAASLRSDLATAWAALPAPPGNDQIGDYRRGSRGAQQGQP